jgi:glycolate oxidase FAD binding subunit
MVLGMKVVLPDGSIASFGGRCVKNVSGYDLCKPFIGSLGTLGIMGEITFKVHPLPERGVIQVGSFRDLSSAFQLCRSLLHSALFPASLEILDPHLAGAWMSQLGIAHREPTWVLLVGWVGFFEDVARLIREGQTAFCKHEITEEAVCESEGARKGWEVLAHLPRYLEVCPKSWVLCRMSLPLVETEEAAASWRREIENQGFKSALSLRAGSGILYGHLFDLSPDQEELLPALERMRNWTTNRKGSLFLENAPVWLKARMDVWGGTGGKEIALMKRLKKHFDPQAILNPGRYVGGI